MHRNYYNATHAQKWAWKRNWAKRMLLCVRAHLLQMMSDDCLIASERRKIASALNTVISVLLDWTDNNEKAKKRYINEPHRRTT